MKDNLLQLLSASLLTLGMSFSANGAIGDVFHVHASLGNDSAAGTASAPWKTIQRAASLLREGEKVVVHEGIYSALGSSYPNSEVAAIKPQHSGTPSYPIVFEAAEGESVIIDQSNLGSGFYIERQDHIVIRGFEIRNVIRGGIWTAKDGETGIIIENNHIHHIDGESGQNVGAIKLDGCRSCVVTGNQLHDVSVGGVRHVNGAGVHSFDMAGTQIVGNTIYDAYTGVFHKRSTAGDFITIRENTIHAVTLGVLFSVAGAGDPAHVNPLVDRNTFYDYETAISTTTHETASRSYGLTITGNHFIGNDAILLWGMDEVTITDNAFSGTQVAIRTVFHDLRPASLSESDYNYYPGDALFVLDEWSPNKTEYGSLAEWQSLTGHDTNSSTQSHPNYPDDEEPNDPPTDDGPGGYFAELFAQYAAGVMSTFECLFGGSGLSLF